VLGFSAANSEVEVTSPASTADASSENRENNFMTNPSNLLRLLGGVTDVRNERCNYSINVLKLRSKECFYLFFELR
jgi:hypothetical protein